MSVFEVRTFLANGTQDKVVQGAKPDFTTILNDSGMVSFSLPAKKAVDAGLGHSVEVALFYDGVEIENSRARLKETEGNAVGANDAPGTGGEVTWAGKTWLSILEKGIVYPSNWPTAPATDGHTFTNATAGAVMKTLINLAQTRGALSGLTHSSWSSTTDANGAAWTQTITFTAPTGASVKSVLEMLVRAGLVDVETVGREMKLYKGDTLGTDWATPGAANPVVLRRGRQVTDLPYSESSEELVNAYLLLGDNNQVFERVNSSSVTQYGRQEGSFSQTGIADQGTLYILGDMQLSKTAAPRSSYTCKVEHEVSGSKPFLTYNVGDWVFLDRFGYLERFRIRQLSASIENDQRHTVVATLNDIFLERDLINERRLEAIVGSTSSDSGGSVTPGPDNPPDTVAPKAPTGLGGTTSAYLDAFGRPRAGISLTWVDPTQSTDNTSIDDLREIRVYRRTDSAVAPWVQINTVAAGEQVAYVSDLDPNTYYRFSIIAVDEANNWSPRSAELRILMAADTTPPVTPSTPTVTVRLSVASIGWNGLDNVGGAMPADFDRLEVHVGTTSTFTPTSANRINVISKAGVVAWPVPSYSTTYYARLVAYDTSGNASPASASTSFSAATIGASDLTVGVAGNRSTVSATAPTSPTPVAGDIWIDTANGNVIKVYDGTNWVLRQDAAISGALQRITTSGSQKTFRSVLDWTNGTASLADNIVIHTPITFGNYMTTLRIKGYNYKAGTTDIDLGVGFRAHSGGLDSTGVTINGSFPAGVRLAKETATNTVAIILSSNDTSNIFKYPKITIPEVIIGHTTPPDSFLDGWTATVETEATVTGAAYTLLTTPPMSNALALASAAQATANGKNVVTYSTAAPTVNDVGSTGDLWWRQSGNQIIGQWVSGGGTPGAYVWTATTLRNEVIATLDAAKITTGFLDVANRIQTNALTIGQVNGLQTTLNAKTTTFAQTSIPTSTAAGDLWVDTDDDNKMYRAAAAGVSTIGAAAWVALPASTTKTFAQTSIPTSVNAGDLWIDTDDANKTYRAFAAGVSTIGSSAWVLIDNTAFKATTDLVNTWVYPGQTTINGGLVQTNTITARQMILGDDKNLVPNGAGELGVLGGWISPPSALYETAGTPSDVRGAVKTASGQGSVSGGGIESYGWDCTPGEQFLVEVWLKADLPNSRIYVELRDQANAHATTNVPIAGENNGMSAGTSYPISNLVVPTVWTKYASLATATATATRMRIGTVYFNHVNGTEVNASQSIAIRIRRKSPGKLIVDGTVTALQLAAGSVVTDKLGARAVTSDKADVGFLRAEHMALGVLRTNRSNAPSFEEDYVLTDWSPFTTGQGDMSKWRKDVVSGSVGGVRSVSAGRSRSGSNGASMTSAAGGSSGLVSNTFETTVGRTYRLVVYAASVTSPATMVISVQKGSTQADITGFSSETVTGDSTWTSPTVVTEPLLSSSFETFSYTWTATAAWTAVRITNFQPAAAATLVIDDVSVVEVGIGGATEITAAGMRLFDDEGNEATALVTNRSNYFSVQNLGKTVASISDVGGAAFTQLNVAGVDSNGDDVPDSGLEVYGRDFMDWQMDSSAGTVAQVYFTSQWNSPNVTSEIGIGEISFEADPQRSYLLFFNGIMWHWVTSRTTAVFGLRYTEDGSPPTVNSFLWDTTSEIAPAATGEYASSTPMVLEGQWNSTPGVPVRVLLTVRRGYGTGSVQVGVDPNGTAFPRKYIRMAVMDQGRAVAETWLGNDGGGGAGTPTTAKKTYVKTYRSTSSGTYTGSGVKRTNTSDVVQGYMGSNGNGRGLWTFPSMTSDLSGATIRKIEVYAYASHWYYSAGGTARIHVHGHTTVPASSPTLTYAIESTKWQKPGGRWVVLPSSFYAGFASGTYRGFGMGPAPSNSPTYYGRFTGGAGALIRVTYVK